MEKVHGGSVGKPRQRVTSSTAPAQLDLWFERAITAGTAAEVFAD